MNYMINDKASKEVAIAFAKWTIINGMYLSDLTFEEQYECWMNQLDDQAIDDQASEVMVDSKYDDFERQIEYMSGAYEE